MQVPLPQTRPVQTLQQRAEEIKQGIRDLGITYNVPNVPGGAHEQPWRVDPIPLSMGAAEFSSLASALAQRARLVARVLDDLYGPQDLLHRGLLPARLVLANPAFLRPVHGFGGRRLLVYAADLVRNGAGSYCVVRDRTQAPTGAGYALVNRLVVSRVLDEPFKQSKVSRLAGFFRKLRDMLESQSAVAMENPSVALQTSGGASPTYSEQSFLAQYLGYPIVEGGDLTVRDRRVFLKTLGGLSRVHVLFRQPDDDYCDPLELRPDSQLGTPGLVDAVRSEQVAVVNGLGSGLLQAPGFLPFLPRIARELLGETLALDTAPSYWCGDASSRSHVLAHLDRMVVRAAWSTSPSALVVGSALHGEARAQLVDRIRAEPEMFVGQEIVASAGEPTLDGARLVDRAVVLRSYVVLDGDDATVMPGGLALAGPAGDGSVVAVASGAIAKDVWVEGDDSPPLTLIPSTAVAIQLSRAGSDLPSRCADNFFWMGRYVERAEAVARLGRHVLARVADEPVDGPAGTAALLSMLAVAAESVEPKPSDRGLPWVARLLASPELPGSVSGIVRGLCRSAGSVRDRLSADMLRVLGALADCGAAVAAQATPASSGVLPAALDATITQLSALSGLAMDSMTRGHGWRFLDMGRRLERALQSLALLRSVFATGAHELVSVLETLLAVSDSTLTYRRRYLAGFHPAAVADLLLTDETNPRAVLFQLVVLRGHLQQIPRDGPLLRTHPKDGPVTNAVSNLQRLDVLASCRRRGDGGPPLVGLLGEIQRQLWQLSEHLCSGYLDHAVLARPLAGQTHSEAP